MLAGGIRLAKQTLPVKSSSHAKLQGHPKNFRLRQLALHWRRQGQRTQHRNASCSLGSAEMGPRHHDAREEEEAVEVGSLFWSLAPPSLLEARPDYMHLLDEDEQQRLMEQVRGGRRTTAAGMVPSEVAWRRPRPPEVAQHWPGAGRPTVVPPHALPFLQFLDEKLSDFAEITVQW